MFVTKLHVQIRRRQSYFAFFLLLLFFAAARRSVFLRRAARFLTLSLPWLFPIGFYICLFCELPKLFRLLDYAAMELWPDGQPAQLSICEGRVPAVHPQAPCRRSWTVTRCGAGRLTGGVRVYDAKASPSSRSNSVVSLL